MSTKKAGTSKKEEPKAEKKNGKGKEKEEVHEEKAESKKAKEADEKKNSKAEKAEKPEKAEKAEAKPAKAAKGSTSAKVYQQSASYSVGETIFHPVWKEEGTVVEVGKTPDGHTRITVQFEAMGVKKLVAENEAKA